jgi:hypothetical protein
MNTVLNVTDSTGQWPLSCQQLVSYQQWLQDTYYPEPVQKNLVDLVSELSDAQGEKLEAVVNHFVTNMFLIRVDYNIAIIGDYGR